MNVNVTEENLRWAWDAILMLKKWQGMDLPKDQELIDWSNDRIKDIKIGIRKHYSKIESEPERRYFDCENAGYYRIFGVTDYKSVADAEEQHEPITCYPDQLGRWFEVSHKFFQRSDGKVCGYVYMAMNW